MAKNLKNAVEYHYDSHSTEEDLVPESTLHRKLVSYLALVLRWLFHGQVCAIHENLNFYQTDNSYEYPVAPDIAVITGVQEEELPSWRVGETGPAPHVVFEIASKETWKKDVEEKPHTYALLGVQEYFYYDPNPVPNRGYAGRRLIGWQYHSGASSELLPDQHGRLWSSHLNSFLVPDGRYLRLSDRHGQLRLTGEEAETRRADAEAEAKRVETRRADALAEKLRSLGIDPNQI